MVPKLGRAAASRENSTRQLLSGGDIGRQHVASSYQWEILEEIPPERVANCMSCTYGRYTYIALSIWPMSLSIALRQKLLHCIFSSTQALLENRGHVLAPVFGRVPVSGRKIWRLEEGGKEG